VSGTAERLWEMIEPYLAEEDIELDDLEIVGSGAASIVRVTIDADEAVDVDRIARVSRGVSRLLDEADPLPRSYTLEVSSPGLERKLRRPAHYRKSIGRELKLKTRMPIDGDKHHRGVIIGADDDAVTVDMGDEERTFAFTDITSAQTVFSWDAKARPGAGKN
jgi:ribosome maturation factor RimP